MDGRSGNRIFRRRSSLVWVALAAGVATACGGGSPAGPASAVISSIAILGVPTAPISPGQSAQLTATATYSDGAVRNLTSGVSWGTSAASVLAVSAAGIITAVAAGEAQVTATSSGVSGGATVRVSGGGGSDVLFQVAVLLSASRVPAPQDVTRVFARATDILLQKTGERMTQTDLASVGPGSALSQATAYVNAHASSPPDGVLALSDDPTSTTYGGYSQTFNLPPPNQNRFPSPSFGDGKAYLAVVDFFHMYARCGYDASGNRISDRSSGGECRNQSGLTCVNNGRYWTCPDALTDLYADADSFTGCSLVHEFMHPFGMEGNYDHYGTAQCTARTGMSQADAQDLRLFQQSCGICPDLYQKFRHR
jgi:hypothetical protein